MLLIIKKIGLFSLYFLIILTSIVGVMAGIPYVQLDDTSGISYLNIFNYNTSIHNNLTGKQGGQAPDEYYHLNYAQYLLIGSLLGNNTYFPFLNVDWINGTNATFINITKGGIEVATLDDISVANLTVINVIDVKNVVGETAIKGSAMMYDSYNAGVNRFDVVYANVSSIGGHADCILAQTLSDNADGLCVVLGIIENMDTSMWNDGDHLWLSDTNGSMTNIANYSRVCVQHLGIVLRSHVTVGTFYARPESRCAIDSWNTTNEMFNAVNNNSFYLLSNPYNFYNESDFDINDYVLSSVLLGYNYFNLSDFNIADYSTKLEADDLYAPVNYNPFNQDLNTTNNVQFNNITIDESIDWENDIEEYANTTCKVIRAGSTYFEVCK